MIELDIRNLILFASIITLGIISTFSDIKDRTIKNKWLGIFFVIGIILNLSINVYDFRFNFIINIIFSFLLGFGLWYIGFWNPGDGKLFLVLTSLIPISLSFVSKNNLYSYDLIVFTFVPVFFVFLIFLIIQTNKQEFYFALKESFNPKIVFNLMVAFFSFQWILNLLAVNFGLRFNFFIGAIILFFIFDGIEKVIKLKLLYVFYITTILRLIIEWQTIITVDFALNFFYQLITFLVFVYFFLHIAYFKFGVHVKIPDLKPGMQLCERIVKEDDEYTVEPHVKISLFMFMHDKIDKKSEIEIKSSGLTQEEIDKIQEWNKKGDMKVGALLIQKRVPYAPFQFLGAIILLCQLIIQNNV